MSAEFLEYIGSSFDDPFEVSLYVNDGTEKVCLARYSVNSLAKEYGASYSNSGKLICVSPEIILNNYSDIWMTGWNTASADISEYAGQFVELKFSVANASDTSYPSAILLDNIHFDNEMVNDGVKNFIPVSETKNSEIVRGIGINSTGRSYILYTSEFEDVNHEASNNRKHFKYLNWYKNLEQVVMCHVSTEEEFAQHWKNMVPGEGHTSIDDVVIICHGNYYALIIDSGYTGGKQVREPQNLTTSPDGKVGTDNKAMKISDLEKKNIDTINIYSCNTGLLDAINVELELDMSIEIGYDELPINKDGEKYTIQGNVAQCFLANQNVNKVISYDGSVSFFDNTYPWNSKTQDKFYTYVKTLYDYRKVVPGRNDMPYTNPSIYANDREMWRKYGFPNGEVIYYRSGEDLLCKYTITEHSFFLYGINNLTYAVYDLTYTINLKTNEQKVRFGKF